MTTTLVLSMPPRRDGAAMREIAAEHGALTRQLAGLQHRMGEQLRAHALRISALEGELLQLRGQLVVARSGLLWGLGVVNPMKRPARRSVSAPAREPAMAEASRVICQTGCAGHAHPWLEADGQCRRTGAACHHIAGPGVHES